MQKEVTRHGVQAAVQPKVSIERPQQIGVAPILGERAEDPIRELTDVALRSAEHEAVRPEVVEERDASVAAEPAPDHDGLLRLQKREVRSGRAAHRAADARGDRVVAGRLGEPRAKRFRVDPRVDRVGELAQRGRDAGARAHDTGVWGELGDRDAQARRGGRVPGRERDREVRGRPVRRSTSPDNEEGLPFFGRPSWKSALWNRASCCPPNVLGPSRRAGGR